jgi:hypothetical protein
VETAYCLTGYSRTPSVRESVHKIMSTTGDLPQVRHRGHRRVRTLSVQPQHRAQSLTGDALLDRRVPTDGLWCFPCPVGAAVDTRRLPDLERLLGFGRRTAANRLERTRYELVAARGDGRQGTPADGSADCKAGTSDRNRLADGASS